MCDSELLSIPSKLNKQNKLDFTAPPLGQSSTLQDLTSSFMIVLPQTVLLVVTPVSQSPLGLHGLQSSTTEIVQQVITLLLFITRPKHLHVGYAYMCTQFERMHRHTRTLHTCK